MMPPAFGERCAAVMATFPRRAARLTLRPLTPDDAADVLAYHRLPEVNAHLARAPRTVEEGRAAIEEWLARPGLTLALVDPASGPAADRVIGEVRLPCERAHALAGAPPTDEVDASLGYALHPDHQGQGLMSEAVATVLGLAFDELGVRRVHAWVFSGAQASARLLERQGFRHESTVRAAVLGRDGAWLDDLGYAMLREEWLSRAGAPTGR